jgi:hypothetical protein
MQVIPPDTSIPMPIGAMTERALWASLLRSGAWSEIKNAVCICAAWNVSCPLLDFEINRAEMRSAS